jgi:hypothetical protein
MSEHLSLSHSNHAAVAGVCFGGVGSLRGSVRLKVFPGHPAAASFRAIQLRRVGSLLVISGRAEKRAWRIQQSRQRRTGVRDSRSWPWTRRIDQRLR